MTYVLDSSALIEILRNGPRTSKILDVVQDEPLDMTSIALHEILVGGAGQEGLIDDLLMDAQILVHDEEAARAGAAIERELSSKGMNINWHDTFIAGICKVHNAVLVTLDKDFARIKGIKARVIS